MAAPVSPPKNGGPAPAQARSQSTQPQKPSSAGVGTSDAADPLTVAVWKGRINDVLKRRVDSNTIKTLKNLLRSDLTDKLATKSKDADDFGAAFNELLFRVIDDYDDAATPFISPFIHSKAFKWDARHGDNGATVLHRAVDKGRSATVGKLAARHRTAVDATDYNGRTPLHYACGDPHITGLLLVNGSSPNVYDDQHITPLHMAAWNPDRVDSDKQAAVVEHLLDNNAEVNTRDVFGDSPLHEAAKNSDYNTMRLLIRGGADTGIVNFENDSPWDVVPKPPSKEILDLLEQPTEKLTAPTFRAIPSKPPRCWSNTSSYAQSDAQSETGGSSAGDTTAGDTTTDVCFHFFASVRFFYRKEPFSWAYPITIHNLLRHKNDDGDENHANERMEDLETKFAHLVANKFGKHVERDSIRADIWRWVHIPANQMSWVTDLVWLLTDQPGLPAERQDKRQDAWKFLERNIAQQPGVKPGSFTRVPHAGDLMKNPLDAGPATNAGTEPEPASDALDKTDPDAPKVVTKDISGSSASIQTPSLYRREIWRDTTKISEDQRLSVVVPFIDFETEQYLQRQEKDPETGEYKINTQRFTYKRILEERSFPYEGLRGLHKPETLDASRYDMLSEADLGMRDKDQVVFKWFQHRDGRGNSRQGDTPKPMGSKPLKLTANTLKSNVLKGTGQQSFGDSAVNVSRLPRLLMVHQLWLWKLNKDTVITAFPERYHQGVEDSLFETIRQSGIDCYTRPEQLVESILFECVTFLEEYRLAGLGLHILDIFDSSIARRSNEEVACFKNFRDSLEKRSVREGVSKEISLIHEIEDIRDELHLILRIFASQRDVVKQFAGVFWPAVKDKFHRMAFVDDCGVQGLIERTKELDRNAQRTRTELDSLVQMKLAQSSLEQAESASRLNNYIMLFTIIAVVFTPLSFMTSLFAIPFDYFPENDEGEIRVHEDWFTRRMIAGELSSLMAIAIIGFAIYAVKLPPWKLFIDSLPQKRELFKDLLHRKRKEWSSPSDDANSTGHSSALDRDDNTRLTRRIRAVMERRPVKQRDLESPFRGDKMTSDYGV
ncbi:uncharacterized protein DNG_08006 [Cephalotrichum gorgonifer]|uniref:Uncharacterized protein n=1 Tax=Cephalotrichum gorgonifer TaxID=2041049 RepID=A0AAE8N4G4_9PEZI|nr:uncharacterized protein DNG_08006 [Cephalotrichum gorgonifer]